MRLFGWLPPRLGYAAFVWTRSGLLIQSARSSHTARRIEFYGYNNNATTHLFAPFLLPLIRLPCLALPVLGSLPTFPCATYHHAPDSAAVWTQFCRSIAVRGSDGHAAGMCPLVRLPVRPGYIPRRTLLAPCHAQQPWVPCRLARRPLPHSNAHKTPQRPTLPAWRTLCH